MPANFGIKSKKFFVLYGNKTVTAHVTDADELPNWVRRDGFFFDTEIYETQAEWIAKAEKILQGRYQNFDMFEYTPAGMAEFLFCAGQQADELVNLHALEIADDYIQDAQNALAVALTEAQKGVIARVQFPVAGDKAAFGKYQAKIAHIRDLSIKSLYEYVEQGDESPE